MAIPRGFEPRTYCLEGSCSIQLSYGTILVALQVAHKQPGYLVALQVVSLMWLQFPTRNRC